VGKVWAAVLLTCAAIVLSAAPANAAVALGTTQSTNTACASPSYVEVQTILASGGPSLTVPSAGVITRWEHDARDIDNALLKLKVLRPLGSLFGNAPFLAVGESAYGDVAEPTLHSFLTRIPVQALDRVGAATASNAGGAPPACYVQTNNSDEIYGAPDFSTTATLSPSTGNRVNVRAFLEPDADGDKYGDETQDSCPTDATVWTGPCPVPATAAKKCKKRKKKGKRHSATAAKKKKKKGCGRKK
jgi:hypothetical protein